MIDVARDFERMRAYIVGRLPDDEVRAFEDRLVRDPELVREFEQSLRLRAGMQELRTQGYFAGRSSYPSRRRLLLPALAAAVIAGLALFLWVQTRTADAPLLTAALDTRGGAVAGQIAAHFTFVAVRSGSTIDLELPARGMIEFRAAPPAHAADRCEQAENPHQRQDGDQCGECHGGSLTGTGTEPHGTNKTLSPVPVSRCRPA